MGSATQPESVRLEVNATGKWSKVLHFNTGDTKALQAVRRAVPLLCELDDATTFRVVTLDARVLLNYSAQHGWTDGE